MLHGTLGWRGYRAGYRARELQSSRLAVHTFVWGDLRGVTRLADAPWELGWASRA